MPSTHKGRTEIVAAVPLVLGFNPRESVVVLGRRETGMYTAACHDLGARETIGLTARAMRRHGVQHSFVVGYSEGDGLAAAVAGACKQVEVAGIEIDDILIVLDDRWIGLGDTTPKGHSIPETSEFASRLAAVGYKVNSARYASTPETAPVSIHRRTEVSNHLDSLTPYYPEPNPAITDTARRLIDNATNQSYPGYGDTAILIVAGWDRRISTYALLAIGESDTPKTHLDLWSWVTRHASGPDIAAPAVLAAAAAHVSASDDRARAFAQAAMTAAVGWPPALLAANTIASLGDHPEPPNPPAE